MHCKHCFYLIDDDSYDVCPNCGKPLKDEPVQEASDNIEIPMKKQETELSKEDQFTANFISKDDPLANIDKVKKSVEKASTAMMISRIAAIVAVLFFIGVIYYTKVVLPKINQQIDNAIKEEPSEYERDTTAPAVKDSIGPVTINSEFGDNTVISELSKLNLEYNKNIKNVDITLDYGTALNNTSFSILLKRTYSSSGAYEDSISFKYGDSKVSGIVRSYNNYNDDLITNFINSYVVTNNDGNVVMYSKSSTFQLSNSTTILLFRAGLFDKIERVITTYSVDGVSIVQCPIEATSNNITYCAIESSFEKKKEMEIKKYSKKYDGSPEEVGSYIGLVAK